MQLRRALARPPQAGGRSVDCLIELACRLNQVGHPSRVGHGSHSFDSLLQRLSGLGELLLTIRQTCRLGLKLCLLPKPLSDPRSLLVEQPQFRNKLLFLFANFCV